MQGVYRQDIKIPKIMQFISTVNIIRPSRSPMLGKVTGQNKSGILQEYSYWWIFIYAINYYKK